MTRRQLAFGLSLVLLLAALVTVGVIRSGGNPSANRTRLFLDATVAPVVLLGEPPSERSIPIDTPFEGLRFGVGPTFDSKHYQKQVSTWVPIVAPELEFVALDTAAIWRSSTDYVQAIRVRVRAPEERVVPALFFAWVAEEVWRGSIVWWDAETPENWEVKLEATLVQGWFDRILGAPPWKLTARLGPPKEK